MTTSWAFLLSTREVTVFTPAESENQKEEIKMFDPPT